MLIRSIIDPTEHDFPRYNPSIVGPTSLKNSTRQSNISSLIIIIFSFLPSLQHLSVISAPPLMECAAS